MVDPVVVILLLALGDGDDPTAVADAARRALGPDAVVVVDERRRLPPDAEALELGAKLHARSVLEVTWTDEAHRTAQIHFHDASEDGWTDRALAFADADSRHERARTLGLAVATMMAERLPPEAAPRSSPAQPSPPSPPSPAADDVAVGRRAAPRPPTTGPAASWRAAIDVLGGGGIGVGREAPGAGGALAARWWLGDAVALRLAEGVRLGSLPAAQASSVAVTTALGAALRALGTRTRRPVEAGVRADVLLSRFAVRREAFEQSRWVGGAELLVEGSWALAPPIGIVVAGGAQVALGTTDIDVGATRAMRVPVVRLEVEIGVRTLF